jgi:hypothetical protein
MWRAFVETALLFLTPFLAYALFHVLQMRWPFVAELWHGREATELLRLPIAPLRLFFCASLLIVASLFLRALFRPRGERA